MTGNKQKNPELEKETEYLKRLAGDLKKEITHGIEYYADNFLGHGVLREKKETNKEEEKTDYVGVGCVFGFFGIIGLILYGLYAFINTF